MGGENDGLNIRVESSTYCDWAWRWPVDGLGSWWSPFFGTNDEPKINSQIRQGICRGYFWIWSGPVLCTNRCRIGRLQMEWNSMFFLLGNINRPSFRGMECSRRFSSYFQCFLWKLFFYYLNPMVLYVVHHYSYSNGHSHVGRGQHWPRWAMGPGAQGHLRRLEADEEAGSSARNQHSSAREEPQCHSQWSHCFNLKATEDITMTYYDNVTTKSSTIMIFLVILNCTSIGFCPKSNKCTQEQQSSRESIACGAEVELRAEARCKKDALETKTAGWLGWVQLHFFYHIVLT